MIVTLVDSHVKCFLRNSMVLEGIVEEWSDTRAVLKSLDGKSLMIVHRPNEDILMTKVMLEEFTEVIPAEDPPQDPAMVVTISNNNPVREKLHEVMQPTGDEELDKLNIKQLRDLVVEQDKKIIRDKTREHFGSPGAPRKVGKYSTPQSAYMPGKLPRM
jgi:hypothetical protein